MTDLPQYIKAAYYSDEEHRYNRQIQAIQHEKGEIHAYHLIKLPNFDWIDGRLEYQNPVDGAKIIQMDTGISTGRGDNSYIKGSLHYLVPPGSMNAYELTLDYNWIYGVEKPEQCASVISFRDFQAPGRNKYDLFNAWSGRFSSGERSIRYNEIIFERAGGKIDYQALNFYNMTRYGRAVYAAQHRDKPDQHMIVTKCFLGTEQHSLTSVHSVNVNDLTTKKTEHLRFNEEFKREGLWLKQKELGINQADYEYLPLKELSKQLCHAVGAVHDCATAEYITPLTYQRTKFDF